MQHLVIRIHEARGHPAAPQLPSTTRIKKCTVIGAKLVSLCPNLRDCTLIVGSSALPTLKGRFRNQEGEALTRYRTVMGYAGYTAAKLPPPKASALQAALWSIDNMECLEVMSKLVRNTAVSPSEDKFKRIKLSNGKVKTTIVDTTGGVPSLLAMGWVYDEADKEFLMLPKGVQMTMKEVRAIEDTKDRLKKQVSYQSRMSKASALPGNADKSAIRSAMEADRLERSSRGPVTQGSTAQALPGGANITTAGDMGLNSGGCC